MSNLVNTNSQILIESFSLVRNQSVAACKPLEIEDYNLQATAFVSPPKWHLAHTTWFFETFILKPLVPDYCVFHDTYELLFNSYYNAIGEQYLRNQRGLLSRPTVADIMLYRKHVDDVMTLLLSQIEQGEWATPERDIIIQRTKLGLEHEKQHQELFYTDIKYSLSLNPLYPAYVDDQVTHSSSLPNVQWQDYAGGLVDMGVEEGAEHFYFDNETPRHKVFLEPFSLSNRLVTNGEFQEFIDDGAYQKPEYWLSDGWATVKKNNWTQPLYWRDLEAKAMEFTLYGLGTRQLDQPVCHISGYEADAYASWANARLPTEAEWEFAAQQNSLSGNAHATLHPAVAKHDKGQALSQLYNSCWQWTASAYRAYPGFQAADGAIGEYNGKFMCNQWVLKGGSCVSSAKHLRPSYRNFFYPEDRWQFSGIRLAKK
jgi:ergothioneine biosynthesis protein EgtB